MASIDDSSAEDKYDDESISTNSSKDIWDGSYVYPDINARDARLKICDRIKQSQSVGKGAELSAKIMDKYLIKVFKVAVKEFKNELTNLGE